MPSNCFFGSKIVIRNEMHLLIKVEDNSKVKIKKKIEEIRAKIEIFIAIKLSKINIKTVT